MGEAIYLSERARELAAELDEVAEGSLDNSIVSVLRASAKQMDALYETERKLCNEVAGLLDLYEHAMRETMGNTNFGVLKLRYEEARAALAKASPQSH